jgi:carboxylesterase type B
VGFDVIVSRALTSLGAQSKGAQFAQYAGCSASDAGCLQQIDLTTLLNAQHKAEDAIMLRPTEMFVTWSPIVDGTELTGQVVELFGKGWYKSVPMIIGDVSDEGRMFVFSLLSMTSPELECSAFIDAIFRLDAGKVRHAAALNTELTTRRSSSSTSSPIPRRPASLPLMPCSGAHTLPLRLTPYLLQ